MRGMCFPSISVSYFNGGKQLSFVSRRILCKCIFKTLYERMRIVNLSERENWPILDDWAVERVQCLRRGQKRNNMLATAKYSRPFP